MGERAGWLSGKRCMRENGGGQHTRGQARRYLLAGVALAAGGHRGGQQAAKGWWRH